jgi:hypothetical protein
VKSGFQTEGLYTSKAGERSWRGRKRKAKNSWKKRTGGSTFQESRRLRQTLFNKTRDAAPYLREAQWHSTSAPFFSLHMILWIRCGRFSVSPRSLQLDEYATGTAGGKNNGSAGD